MNAINSSHKKKMNWRLILAASLMAFGVVGMFFMEDATIIGATSFAIYIFAIAALALFYRESGVDPMKIFCALTFIGFGIGYVIHLNNPELFYFMHAGSYSPAFQYKSEYLSTSFLIFLIGFGAYVAGSQIVLPLPLLRKTDSKINTYLMSGITLVLVIFTYWFRAEFKVGVPGVEEAAFPFVGYIYHPMLALVTLSLGYAFFCALRSGSVLAIAVSLMVVLIHAGSIALLGWKSAIFKDILLLVLIYVNYSTFISPITVRIRRFLLLSLFLGGVLAYVSFGAIGYYRASVVLTGEPMGLAEFFLKIPQYFEIYNELSEGTSNSGVVGFFVRISGINYLTPVVSYFSQYDISSEVPSFILNATRLSYYNPENFLTDIIVGVPEALVTTNAPGAWGAFYIYGAEIGVFVGMLISGLIFQNSYRFFKKNSVRNPLMLVLYAVVIVDIYLAVVFEGTVVNYLFKNIPALLIAYVILSLMIRYFYFSASKQLRVSMAMRTDRQNKVLNG